MYKIAPNTKHLPSLNLYNNCKSEMVAIKIFMSRILSTIVGVKLVNTFDVMVCSRQEVECAFPGLCGCEWVLTIVPLKAAGKC